MRAWFDRELITEAGTRSMVHQGEETTGSLPNAVVRRLQERFLVRAEARGGDTWIELVHDRFVEPIRASNAAWFPEHLSALQRQAALWDEQGRSSGLLLRDAALAEAEKWAADHGEKLQPDEQEFLAACRQAQEAASASDARAGASVSWGWWQASWRCWPSRAIWPNSNDLPRRTPKCTGRPGDCSASAAEAGRQKQIAENKLKRQWQPRQQPRKR